MNASITGKKPQSALHVSNIQRWQSGCPTWDTENNTPIKEHRCENESCPSFGIIEEHFFHVSAPEPVCENCGQKKRQMISRFNSPFMGAITHKYMDTRLENGHAEGGQWMYARNTPDGKPRAEFIETFAQAADFAKREGLTAPHSLNAPGNIEISADGKSASSQGMPGSWV